MGDLVGRQALHVRKSRQFAVLGAVLLAVGVSCGSASAAVTVQHVQSSGAFFDQCTGELVDATTSITFLVGSRTGPTGTLFTLSHFTQTGTAIGETSGDRYRFVSVQSDAEIDLSFEDATRTLTSNLAVIGQAGISDEHARTTFHFTERDGQLIVTVSDISFDCS
jgi:hypothetical protein